MASLFDAALSAHFHTAYLLGDDKLHQKHEAFRKNTPSVNYRRWRRLVDRTGTGGPILSNILSPERAIHVVQQYHDRTAGVAPLRSKRSRRALAEWHYYDWAFQQLHGRPHRTVSPALKGLTDRAAKALRTRGAQVFTAKGADKIGELRTTLDKIEDPNEAYGHIYEAVHAPALTSDPEFGNAKFKLLEATIDSNGVTRIQAQLEHEDKTETVENVARHADPRLWMQNYPEIWPSAYCIRYGEDTTGFETVLQDRFASPSPVGNIIPGGPIRSASKGKARGANVAKVIPGGDGMGKSFTGYLYEHVQSDFEGISIFDGTVVLFVDFQVVDQTDSRSANGYLTLVYRLYEALSNSILCYQTVGGPDVDSAGKNGPNVPESYAFTVNKKNGKGPNVPPLNFVYQVKLDDGVVTSRVGKHVRYPKSVRFSDELNAISLPLWSWAAIGGLYRSVKLDEPKSEKALGLFP